MGLKSHAQAIEERKEEKRNEKRLRILQAAEKIFLDKGFHAASMNEIAEVARVSTPHLYNFYESKAALALAVQEKMSSETFESISKAMNIAGEERVCPTLFDSRRSSLALTILTESTRNPEIAEKVKENGERLRKKISEVWGMTDSTEDQYRVLAVMALFFGISISNIFTPMTDRELIGKILTGAEKKILNK